MLFLCVAGAVLWVRSSRVADLYEVCGQAQKSIMWRRSDLRPFFRTLEDRARKKLKRTGVNPFEVGGIEKLYEIQDRFWGEVQRGFTSPASNRSASRTSSGTAAGQPACRHPGVPQDPPGDVHR